MDDNDKTRAGNRHTEYGGSSGTDRTLPDGRRRPLSDKELAQAERSARMRDEPLPPEVALRLL